tara:strand:+ start:1699 stop:2079 length:381 start_codon:yes stop_codon:yes gene_type:complete
MDKLKQEDKRYHIDTSRKVFVYKNLHKDCWSVKQDGLVKAHTKSINLWDCSFRVNAKGRAKVLEEKRKNVHAGIVGYIDENEMAMTFGTAVTYNPYKYSTFVEKDTEDPVIWRGFASLDHNTVLAA